MEFDPKDLDIVSLLTKLKDTNGGYPSKLLASRRKRYLEHVANIGLGIGVGAAHRNMTRSGKSAAGSSTAAGTLIETALVLAIVAQASAAAYIYRDRLKDLIQSFSSTPRAEEVTSPTVVNSPQPQVPIIPSETEPPILLESPVSIPTVDTPAPFFTGEANQAEGDVQIASTPNPGGNQGNHYGQTPKPDRTKKPDRKPPRKPKN